MKRLFIIAFAVCLLTVPAFAADWLDFTYTNEDGVRVVDVDAYNAAVAEEKVTASGLDLDIDSFWIIDSSGKVVFDNDSFELAYAAALEAREEVETIVDDPVVDPAGDPSAVDDPSASAVSDPDASGGVLFPEGDVISSGSSPVLVLDSESSNLDLVSDDEDSAVVSDDEDTVLDVYAISDLRTGDAATWSVVSGLKALIISIFGEYTPVMTTMAVTETVDGVTTTTLIDAVAEGAAGVDYEWLSGVFLFGILLYCLMKLLGGILK